MKHLILVIAILAGANQSQAQPTADCLELKKVKISDHVLHQQGWTQATVTFKVKDCEIIEDHQQTTVQFESPRGLDVTLDDIAFRRPDNPAQGASSNQVKEMTVTLKLAASPWLPAGETTLRGMLTYRTVSGGAVVAKTIGLSIPLKIAPPERDHPVREGFRNALVVVAEIVGGIVFLPVWLIYCPISRQCG